MISDERISLNQGRVELALHTLQRAGDRDRPLLLLHALGGSSADWSRDVLDWPGSVHALDFSGHGESDWVTGGVYYPELLVADADAAVAHIGPLHVLGVGLGAYVALLLAGGRPEEVRGALLLPGDGLEGCGPQPDFDSGRRDFVTPHAALSAGRPASDPHVRILGNDARPVDYVESFAARATRLVLGNDGKPRPDWWSAAGESPSAEKASPSLSEALRALANG